ncbi:DUF4184 family protein [Massilia sp. TSP1-1-2]|uniref:DUF4184 family protein n=1 Tax=unclassified Massilia TaxID=2609279 RepID=UPI003CF2247C
MPFTLCHPALVIPLHRHAGRLTSLPGLVIGSMAPDFVYFCSLGVTGKFSHSVPGILIYCVPAGAAVLAIYYALMREPLLAWLPQALSSRMEQQVPTPWYSARAVRIVLISLIIGAASHIFWDAFTHADTPIVHRFSLFRSFITVGGHDIALFKVLQQVSNLLGLIVIASYIVAWCRRTAPDGVHRAHLSTRQRFLSLAAVGAAAAAGGTTGVLLRSAVSVEHGLFNFVVTGMACAALATVCLCVAWKMGRAPMKR